MRWIVHGLLLVALAALGARIRFRLAADVILAPFFVSHLTPFGSATGTLVNG